MSSHLHLASPRQPLYQNIYWIGVRLRMPKPSQVRLRIRGRKLRPSLPFHFPRFVALIALILALLHADDYGQVRGIAEEEMFKVVKTGKKTAKVRTGSFGCKLSLLIILFTFRKAGSA